MADSSSRKSGGAQRSRQVPKTGEKSSSKLIRVGMLLICCLGAGYFFWSNMNIIDANENAAARSRMAQPPDPAMEAEKVEIETAEQGMENITRASNAMQLALLAEVQGRYPLDLPSSLTSTASSATEIAPIEPDPPYVTVVAIMITDNDRVAVVNVSGEGEGILMRQGARFSDGTATLTTIDEKGVTFTWRRRNYQVSL